MTTSKLIRLRRAIVLALLTYTTCLGVFTRDASCAELVLEPKMRHLRNAEPREWSDFPATAEATELTYQFEVTGDFRPQTLRLRHRDLRRDWILYLDGQVLIRLAQGDQDATTFWPLPAEKLKPGKHELRIACKDKTPDDVMLGELRLDTRTKAEILGDATIDVEVRQFKETGGIGDPIPCRLTLVDDRGSLMTVGIEPEPRLAIRPGVIYTLDGRARFTVPAGKYTLYASRGFEYSVAETKLELKPGDVTNHRLRLEHEVSLFPVVGVDPHVHTLTHSGHGDCTIEERVVTLLGEGLAGAAATDHNKAIDYGPTLKQLGDPRVAILIGNEVTTKIGHFNVFPLTAESKPIDHQGTTWADVGAAIKQTMPKGMVILNHARDIHNGFRPFGPERHIAVAGEDVAGWVLPANAMEVFNSGSTQNDPTRLFHDWLGLLSRGEKISPIGSSDSHDVARYIVGQGRTYVAVFDESGDSTHAIVGASMGLLCYASAGDAEHGELATRADAEHIRVEVHHPKWIKCDDVRLFVNSVETETKPVELIPEARETQRKAKKSLEWKLPTLKHDVHIVAIAQGPGVDAPYWPIAKPYQPTSPDWKSYVIGCSAAVRIDGDGDGKYSSPYDYAKQLFAEHGADDAKLVSALADYDEAVAVQTASVARAAGKVRFEAFLDAVEKHGAAQTKSGARKYFAGWRATLVGTPVDGAGAGPNVEKK